MLKMPINRRTLISASTLALIAPRAVHAQQVYGRIAFIKDGHIMQWSPDGVVMLREDGNASAPTWEPDSPVLVYVRRGESFSNLIALDTETDRTRRLTDSESEEQPGSQDYVLGSDWIVDPFWSESGIIAFASTADSSDATLGLWILRYKDDLMFPAPTDYSVVGHLEKVTVDATGDYACYTVLADSLRSSHVGIRNLNTGVSWVAMEGAQGAYDGAISPNGRWVIGTIRDSDGLNDLWLHNVESEETVRLTEGEQASSVCWDYFGEWAAYLAYVDDGFSLRAFQIDFSGDEPSIAGDIQVLIEQDQIDSTSRLSWTR